MSGHSKWAKIKHQKAVTDVRKGKVFSLLSRQITMAVKQGRSGDPADNPRLRLSLEKAREANLPKDNVKRAIERGLGRGGSGVALSEVVIEGYGPGGVAIMVTALTDNRNRATSEIMQLFSRFGGTTGEPGSVAYIFSGGDPQYTVPVSPSQQHQISSLLDLLDEQEDIEEVRHNALFSSADGSTDPR